MDLDSLGEPHVPIGPVEKLLPREVPVVRELHIDDRIPTRLDGVADQAKPRLLWRSTAFSDVALVARADDVLPTVAPASGSRYDMVQAQLGRRVSLAAILTGVAVAGEEVSTVESDFLFRKSGKRQNTNDPRDSKVKADRADPIVARGLELLLERAQLGPVIEVVRDVLPVLDTDDFRDRYLLTVPLEQEGERPPHTHNAQSQIMRVEQQDVAVKARRWIGYGTRCEDDTTRMIRKRRPPEIQRTILSEYK